MDNATATPSKTEQKPSAAAELQHGLAAGAHEVSDGVKHLAQDVAGQAKKTAETALAARKDVAVEGVRSVALALRHTSERLRTENEGPLPDFVSKAADRVEQVSSYLQSRTLGQVVSDVESFARREPALFLGGAFVGGLVGGRFLKSSAPTRSDAPQKSSEGSRAGVPKLSFEERDTLPGASAGSRMGIQGSAASSAPSFPRPSAEAKTSPYASGYASTEKGAAHEGKPTFPVQGAAAPSPRATTLGVGVGATSSHDPGRGRV